MANDTAILETHAPEGQARIDHVKDLTGSDRLLKHLTEVHGVKNVPVSKAGQSKAHALLHPAPAPEPEPEPEPTPAPKVEEAPVQGPKTELETLREQVAQIQSAPAARPAKPDFSTARNTLFTMAVTALDKMVAELSMDEDPEILAAMSKEDAARLVSQAIHHFATGRDAEGKRVWPATTLPKPNRSDWR